MKVLVTVLVMVPLWPMLDHYVYFSGGVSNAIFHTSFHFVYTIVKLRISSKTNLKLMTVRDRDNEKT